jgi:CheY-like chemotaxis protein
MSLLILVVDDEPDVEMLFRQHFRRDLRGGRFTMEFAQSGEMALQRIADAAGVSQGLNCCPRPRRRGPMCRSL